MYRFIVFNYVREIIFISIIIPAIVFSFIMNKDINTLRDLKVKTNFNSEIKNYNILNAIEKIIENDEANKYEEFFKKYN